MLHDSLSPSPYQSQTSQHYSPVILLNVEKVEDLDPFFGSQHYSPAQGSGGPYVPIKDDSPVEEVAAVTKKV